MITRTETHSEAATMTEIDSVAAARELRDSVPADQLRLWQLLDSIVKSFERTHNRRHQRGPGDPAA